MKILKLIVSAIIVLFSFTVSAQKMDNKKLGKIIVELSDTVVGQLGMWEFRIGNVPMMCITDENHNRMRFISPIKKEDEVTDAEMDAAMEANFHSALDVRYAVSNGAIWVAFIHPLKELSEDEVRSAMLQVYNANITFGETYSSSELVFPKSKNEKEKAKKL